MRWWKHKRGLGKTATVIGGLVVLLSIIATASCGGDEAGTTTGAAPPSVTETTGITPTTANQTTTAPAAPATTESKGKWTTVFETSGSASQRFAPFELTGAPARMRYTVSKDAAVLVVAIYVLPEGTDLEKVGGIPEVMTEEAGSDETPLKKDPGRYFVQVKAANAQWRVTIEEQR